MATQDDVRRIATMLPGTIESPDRFAFSVLNKGREKGFAWVWMERIEPKKARVPQPKVLAVRVSGEEDKDFLIQSMPDAFFTERHYNGFPAILIRLDAIELEQLETLVIDAWHLQAPKDLIAEYTASKSPTA